MFEHFGKHMHLTFCGVSLNFVSLKTKLSIIATFKILNCDKLKFENANWEIRVCLGLRVPHVLSKCVKMGTGK